MGETGRGIKGIQTGVRWVRSEDLMNYMMTVVDNPVLYNRNLLRK